MRLCASLAPAMANISPWKYSLLYPAARSISRYCSGVRKVFGCEDIVSLCDQVTTPSAAVGGPQHLLIERFDGVFSRASWATSAESSSQAPEWWHTAALSAANAGLRPLEGEALAICAAAARRLPTLRSARSSRHPPRALPHWFAPASMPPPAHRADRSGRIKRKTGTSVPAWPFDSASVSAKRVYLAVRLHSPLSSGLRYAAIAP